MRDIAQALFAEVYHAHSDLQPNRDSPMAQFTTWLAINMLFDVKSRAPAVSTERMWFDHSQQTLFGHLADILEATADLPHSGFPALDREFGIRR
jgi:hypothetical protein